MIQLTVSVQHAWIFLCWLFIVLITHGAKNVLRLFVCQRCSLALSRRHYLKFKVKGMFSVTNNKHMFLLFSIITQSSYGMYCHQPTLLDQLDSCVPHGGHIVCTLCHINRKWMHILICFKYQCYIWGHLSKCLLARADVTACHTCTPTQKGLKLLQILSCKPKCNL